MRCASSAAVTCAGCRRLARRGAAAVAASRHRSVASAASTRDCEHSAYLSDLAALPAPPQLPALLRALSAQGQTPVAPSARKGLHPLLIPLALSADGLQVTGVLRWPSPPDEFVLPIVTCPSRPAFTGMRLSLVSRSASEYIHRALAEEDAANGGNGEGPVASAVGTSTPMPFAFATGDAARAMRAAEAAQKQGTPAKPSGSSRHAPLDVYLTQKCGKFPDVCARLVRGHIAAGDATAAMVTADWACTHFKGWASVRAASAATHAALGRADEARDYARAALAGGSLWTLGWHAPGDTAAETLQLAQLSGRTAAWLRENLVDGPQQREGGAAAAPGQPSATMTPQQLALARAETLLDALALGELSWGDVSSDVQASFTAAGRPEIARFLAGCPI